jgi:hypothetical protein
MALQPRTPTSICRLWTSNGFCDELNTAVKSSRTCQQNWLYSSRRTPQSNIQYWKTITCQKLLVLALHISVVSRNKTTRLYYYSDVNETHLYIWPLRSIRHRVNNPPLTVPIGFRWRYSGRADGIFEVFQGSCRTGVPHSNGPQWRQLDGFMITVRVTALGCVYVVQLYREFFICAEKLITTNLILQAFFLHSAVLCGKWWLRRQSGFCE